MPPYAAMAMLRAESTDAAAALELLRLAADVIRDAWDSRGDHPNTESGTPFETAEHSQEFELMGPAPAPLARLRNRLRYQFMICARRRRPLHAALSALEAAELTVPGVRWSIDVDPLDTF